MDTIHRVIKFVTAIVVIIATIALAVTGIQMAYYGAAGGGNALEILKKRLSNIIIGFLLILASWTIIDTLLKALVTDGDILNNWRTPMTTLCGYQKVAIEGIYEDVSGTVTRGTERVDGLETGDLTVNRSMNPIFDPADGGSHMVRHGAGERMHETLAGPFARLEAGFGRSIVINDAIAKAGTSRETKTKNSRHFHGDALDLSTAGMSDADKLRLFREAKKAGFTGFGFGRNILHVDRGARRSWSYGNATYGGVSVSTLKREAAGP